MKKLFTILLVIVLASCGSSLEPPKSNTDYKNIIGKPFKIGNIEVAEKDFPKTMNWEDAKKACEALGNGWRLPTMEELKLICHNKFAIGNIVEDWNLNQYWTSTKSGEDISGTPFFKIITFDDFCTSNSSSRDGYSLEKYRVRAVR